MQLDRAVASHRPILPLQIHARAPALGGVLRHPLPAFEATGRFVSCLSRRCAENATRDPQPAHRHFLLRSHKLEADCAGAPPARSRLRRGRGARSHRRGKCRHAAAFAAEPTRDRRRPRARPSGHDADARHAACAARSRSGAAGTSRRRARRSTSASPTRTRRTGVRAAVGELPLDPLPRPGALEAHAGARPARRGAAHLRPLRARLLQPGHAADRRARHRPGLDDLGRSVVVAHEYGHHFAANNNNSPWEAVDYGTKRWASYMGICKARRRPRCTRAPRTATTAQSRARASRSRFAFSTSAPRACPRAPGTSSRPSSTRTRRALAGLQQDVATPWHDDDHLGVKGTFTKKGTLEDDRDRDAARRRRHGDAAHPALAEGARRSCSRGRRSSGARRSPARPRRRATIACGNALVRAEGDAPRGLRLVLGHASATSPPGRSARIALP